MTLYQDTKKSYYDILANKVSHGNEKFTVKRSNGSCYSGSSDKHQWSHTTFIKLVNSEIPQLRNVEGNIIKVDESIFLGFPQSRPANCMSQDQVIKETGSADWTRGFYWRNKQDEYLRIKNEIDLKLDLIKIPEEIQNITFNEQTNSGDFNETPITDINIIDGCSGCGVGLENIIKETQNKEKYMKFVGIAAIGVIALLVVRNG
tara:strand:+ start:68 stop:679 length:612 start_codon:yes stop_codon:yes gene_type:complete